MFGSDILEVATGIVFVFILISTICTSLREGLEGWFKTRASFLEYGIRELLQDRAGTGLAKQVFEHPLVFGLYAGDYKPLSISGRPGSWTSGKNLPSYIPSRNFALALMDLAARGPVTDGATAAAGAGSLPAGPSLSLREIRANVAKIQNPQVQRALLTAIDAAQGDFDTACTNVEHWYDSAMDRVSGWYKRSTQWVLFWIALVTAVVLNVNTITIADYLYRHDAQRQALVATIDKTAATQQVSDHRYERAKTELDSLHLPMGWSTGWGAPRTRSERNLEPINLNRLGGLSPWEDIFAPLLGWLFTAFAAMLGAPFWFDVLNQIMVIRSTVKPHEKSGEEASMDRQAAPAQPPPTPMPPTPAAITTQVASTEHSTNDDPCGVGAIIGTPDENLPPAQGGVG